MSVPGTEPRWGGAGRGGEAEGGVCLHLRISSSTVPGGAAGGPSALEAPLNSHVGRRPDCRWTALDWSGGSGTRAAELSVVRGVK